MSGAAANVTDDPPAERNAAPPVALTIAGSDSGGGAGIQADLKTFAAHGVFGVSAISAVTAQNTLAVSGVQEIGSDLVSAQIAAVVSDFPVGSAKTGMLSSAPIIRAVARAVDEHGLRVVVDPVMVAKSGDRLLRPDAVVALREELLPRAALLTPNLPEASDLTGMPVDDEKTMRKAGERLLDMGASAVLMKGGHLDGDEIVDLFLDGSGAVAFRGRRIRTRATHGTGCTLSAAVAANLACGCELAEAVERAREYLLLAMRRAAPLGAGHGPLGHLPALGPAADPTASDPPTRFRISDAPLDAATVAAGLSTPADGAVVVFSGIVRARNQGRAVLHLEYEAYEAMVLPVMERLAEDARERFGVERLRIHHRVGRVDIGEPSVLVAVAAPHRGTAFEAARHTMNEVKRIVPIWKREFFEGGAVWVEGPKEPVTE